MTLGVAAVAQGASDELRGYGPNPQLPEPDAALIPAETINDRGVFLDDVRFEDLREKFAFPVHPSYDFVDVLGQPDGLLSRDVSIVAR